MNGTITQLRYHCGQSAQWTIGATRCDDKCANAVLLETQGPRGSERRCRSDTVTHDTSIRKKDVTPPTEPARNIFFLELARKESVPYIFLLLLLSKVHCAAAAYPILAEVFTATASTTMVARSIGHVRLLSRSMTSGKKTHESVKRVAAVMQKQNGKMVRRPHELQCPWSK